MSNDKIYALIDETANMLRGMTLDPAIPQHAKSAMWARIQTLEEALEKRQDWACESPCHRMAKLPDRS